ncbi:recombinase family protein [Shouchella lehensis]|uniref:DNA recombinase n=1 Tax=Shouchella lehensis G1 TaxID=1246626 RepID=A0A060M3A3_9BACI|nr:recombinase family protein [Shouchella lehensis]AIC96500.1 DNA recombinase [Shouchella lehensis G1]
MSQALQFDDPVKRVAIYARVSTSEQAEEGYSIDEQLNVLREWCARQHYDIYDEYVDRGISGKNMNRPELQHLLTDAKRNCFDVVVVWKMNRLARNVLDMLQMVKHLKHSNVDFRSFKENLETETPAGKLQFHMLASVSEFERDNIAENVKMGMIARAKEGSWNGGRVLGYDSIEDTTIKSKRKARKLVINEKEALTVRRVFQLYLQGNGYKSIANLLNREGHRTKRQGDFSINAVKTILENPIYVGKIRYNVRRDWTNKRRKGINPNPIIQQGNHSPIITEDEWTRTQAILKQRSCKPNRVHSGEFPLTGIIRCPECGAGMVLGRTTNKKKDGTLKVLEYYVCGTWKNKGSSVCHSNGVRTQYADEYVLKKLAKLANNQSLIESIVHRINTQHASVTKPLEQERSMIQKELEEQATKKERLLELYKEGIINKQDFKKDYSKMNILVDQLELRMEPLKQQLRQEDTPKLSSETVKHVMNNFQTFFQSAGSMEQRKFLLHLLIKQITIGPDRQIDTIQIQLNKDVLEGLTKEGESTYDVDSPSFSFVLNIT